MHVYLFFWTLPFGVCNSVLALNYAICVSHTHGSSVSLACPSILYTCHIPSRARSVSYVNLSRAITLDVRPGRQGDTRPGCRERAREGALVEKVCSCPPPRNRLVRAKAGPGPRQGEARSYTAAPAARRPRRTVTFRPTRMGS